VKRKFRLSRSSDFLRVRRYGSSTAHPLFVLVVLPNDLELSRIGVVAGRQMGNAVRRNRAKRLMRAAMQLYFPRISPGWDLILIARRPLLEATFSQIENALSTLLHRKGLLGVVR
jgi:ribonuclease P protein component